MPTKDRQPGALAALLALVVAAQATGDKSLTTHFRNELESRFGVRVTFSKPTPTANGQRKGGAA